MTKTEIEDSLSSFPSSWQGLLKEETEKEYYRQLIGKVSDEYLRTDIYPPYDHVYDAFKYTSLDDLEVIILGQDPYHEEGQANGLAFSVSEGTPLPRSLSNIYKELNIEYGYEIPKYNGSLVPWARQGVLLLNASLTVRKGEANSHARYGWQRFTDDVISLVDSLDKPVVYLLWGNFARKKEALIHSKNASIVSCAHPSPLSASRGFFHSDCFRKVNQYLREKALKEIDWQIKDE